MTPTQFIWWLTGFMECINTREDTAPTRKEWEHIQEILRSVTSWEIEQGENK